MVMGNLLVNKCFHPWDKCTMNTYDIGFTYMNSLAIQVQVILTVCLTMEGNVVHVVKSQILIY